MAYNASDRSIGDSWISGIDLHIGKTFTPPAKVTLPLRCEFGNPTEVLFMEYDFSLEEQVISWAENDRKQRELAAEREAHWLASAVSDQAVESEDEEDDAAITGNSWGMVNGRLPHDNNMGNMNINAAAQTSMPPQFAARTPADAPAPTSGILMPTHVNPQTKPQDKKHEHAIKFADFEREEDPFDKVELETLDHMKELQTVLQTTLPSVTPQNGLMCTGNGIYKTSKNYQSGLPGEQTTPLPKITTTLMQMSQGMQSKQTVNALPQCTTRPVSASFPQTATAPNAVVAPANQDSVQIFSTGNVRYSPMPDGRSFVPYALKGSQSSPDISNNITHGTRTATQATPTYTPPPYPTRVQAPPPRPSHPQNQYQSPPTKPHEQTELKNGTSDTRQTQPQLPQSAVTLISRVTAMGFPQSRVEQAVRTLGEDDKQVIDYLCLEDRLVEQGYRTDDVEASFVLFSNDEVKVAQYLQLLTRFREFGFVEEKIKEALVANDLDEGRAIDNLMGT